MLEDTRGWQATLLRNTEIVAISKALLDAIEDTLRAMMLAPWSVPGLPDVCGKLWVVHYLLPSIEASKRTELYRLGTKAVQELSQKQNGWIAAVIILGDKTDFGLTVWVVALGYEVSKFVDQSLVYATFLLAQIILAILFTYSLWLAVYVVQIVVLLYMVAMVILLKVKGWNMESVHEHFVTSSLYRRSSGSSLRTRSLPINSTTLWAVRDGRMT
ncbi:hypothetical protein V7S43_006643 [Phytophthora oleae]|uniref:Uncharacterized protein n=1 Tax=Phytophthora oleae TaxID=2107226 RepID=A0ABD3FS81_9STRA